jgi:NAD-dependent SIR2 family protein deacetylase
MNWDHDKARAETIKRHGSANQYLCTDCKTEWAEEWDHISPDYDPNKVEAVCKECHNKRTQTRAQINRVLKNKS